MKTGSKLIIKGLDYIDMTLMHFPIGQAGGKSSYDYVAVSGDFPSDKAIH